MKFGLPPPLPAVRVRVHPGGLPHPPAGGGHGLGQRLRPRGRHAHPVRGAGAAGLLPERLRRRLRRPGLPGRGRGPAPPGGDLREGPGQRRRRRAGGRRPEVPGEGPGGRHGAERAGAAAGAAAAAAAGGEVLIQDEEDGGGERDRERW